MEQKIKETVKRNSKKRNSTSFSSDLQPERKKSSRRHQPRGERGLYRKTMADITKMVGERKMLDVTFRFLDKDGVESKQKISLGTVSNNHTMFELATIVQFRKAIIDGDTRAYQAITKAIGHLDGDQEGKGKAVININFGKLPAGVSTEDEFVEFIDVQSGILGE